MVLKFNAKIKKKLLRKYQYTKCKNNGTYFTADKKDMKLWLYGYELLKTIFTEIVGGVVKFLITRIPMTTSNPYVQNDVFNDIFIPKKLIWEQIWFVKIKSIRVSSCV